MSVHLEPAAQAFVEATAKPPFLYQMPPEKGRAAVDEAQGEKVASPPVDVVDQIIAGGPHGDVEVRIVRPQQAPAKLPVVIYMHGGGWVFGNAHTHDKLIRELAAKTQAAVVFPKYTPSPEARYPVALEQGYAVLQWAFNEGAAAGFDTSRIAVAGDSVGGNMATALTILARDRQGPRLCQQLLFYPVTDASFDTPSYEEFATGYFLHRNGMKWFWDQYLPDREKRNEITAAPLRATLDQLQGLPRALVITAEADVLRDEGEAYANKLRQAGVDVTAVRFQGIVHDFVMLNTLDATQAARGAMLLATAWLRTGFGMPA